MKALTLRPETQGEHCSYLAGAPWPFAICYWGKRIENRSGLSVQPVVSAARAPARIR